MGSSSLNLVKNAACGIRNYINDCAVSKFVRHNFAIDLQLTPNIVLPDDDFCQDIAVYVVVFVVPLLPLVLSVSFTNDESCFLFRQLFQ